MSQDSTDGTDPFTVRADDAALAVVAHGLLGSISVIQGAAEMLASSDFDAPVRSRLHELIDEQCRHTTGVLRDLMAGLPGSVILALREFDAMTKGEPST
jgi:signal transduction histidine kinase